MAKRRKKRKTYILCLDHDDPEKELDFEVRFQLTLTTAERFKRMWTRSRQVAAMMAAYGHKKTPGITQRS